MNLLSFVTISLLAITFAFGISHAQQVGTNQAENHPPLSISVCTNSSGCRVEQHSIVLDSNWRWTHNVGGSTNCYTGNTWNSALCPDPVTCSQNCAIDGADYQGTYGIQASGNSLSLRLVTHGPYSVNIGSRVYLLNNDSSYYIFNLKNKEFSFDVDVSGLPCGLNGALYFVEMPADGGLSEYANNKAGAKYGTGYCDAQCPHDIKFINGEANTLDWQPSPDDPNSGIGKYGSCCIEMDIWEANSISEAYTPHPCSIKGQYRCSGNDCGDGDNRYGGVCDKDGCDFNSFRMGVQNFFGPGMNVDTNSKITVTTQFITSDQTSNGDLVEIRRLYVQNGKVIQNSQTKVAGMGTYDSVTDKFCSAQKVAFGDKNSFQAKGGLKTLGDALGRGVVLVMSLWDDHAAHMLWLDSDYPVNGTVTTPGVARGTCPTTSGVPSDVESKSPDATVHFSNIKWGDIGTAH